MVKKIFVCLLASAMMTISAFAQSVVITGTVIGKSDGEPLIGAGVIEVGTTNGTITDYDGNFTLKVEQGAQLEFSYVGY